MAQRVTRIGAQVAALPTDSLARVTRIGAQVAALPTDSLARVTRIGAQVAVLRPRPPVYGDPGGAVW
jgi:hypothetical protein